jgi:hypothetical protein
MSVFRAYWCRPILGGKSILGVGLFWEEIIFWEKAYFWSTCNRWKKINMRKKKENKHAEGGKETWCTWRKI